VAQIGLECWAGNTRLILPIDAIRQVIEYVLSPAPPMARRFVDGLAIHEGRLIVSLALAPALLLPVGTRVKAVLLQRAKTSPVDFAMAVTRVGGFVSCEPVNEPRDPRKPTWLSKVNTDTKHLAVYVDVPAFLAVLARPVDGEGHGVGDAG
jgi:hypothetical protein